MITTSFLVDLLCEGLSSLKFEDIQNFSIQLVFDILFDIIELHVCPQAETLVDSRHFFLHLVIVLNKFTIIKAKSCHNFGSTEQELVNEAFSLELEIHQVLILIIKIFQLVSTKDLDSLGIDDIRAQKMYDNSTQYGKQLVDSSNQTEESKKVV